MDDCDTEFNRQLEFIIQQLNKPDDGTFESQLDSDDEGDEDDDEVVFEKILLEIS